jgi:transcriptional regulator with XRE-family HTH domain
LTIVARNLTIKPPISGAQLRAARALLKWSVRDLSDHCRISQSAIAHSEQVDGTPPMRVQNLAAIRRVFEDRGIEFLGLDGVRLLTMSLPKAPAVKREAEEDWGR